MGSAPLRIIQVNSQFNGGGVDTQTLELCAGLTEAGHQVLLAINAGARWEARARAIPGLRVAPFRGGKLAWGFHLKHLARRFDAHILQAHHGRDYWTTGIAARLAGGGVQAVLARHLLTPLSRISARHLLTLGHVVAVSQAVYAQLQTELSGDFRRLRLVYSGVDTARFHPDPVARASARAALGWDETKIVFAVIGAVGLPEGKGQRTFIEAGARLIAEHPEVRLLIVGDGGLLPILQRRIAELGLTEQIRCTGFVDDVERITNLIDVLVHPAVGTEALGLVLWEAMACGKPVIASHLGGIPEAFRTPDHGELVAPRDVDALHAAMRRYATDADLRQRSGAAARQHVLGSGYTRSGQARRFDALYREICQNSCAGHRRRE